MPEHLQYLYRSTCVSRCEDESSRIAECLINFKDTFSKDEFDLGLTSLVEHEIDVGKHKPFKQPPRRVPVAFASEEEKVVKPPRATGNHKKKHISLGKFDISCKKKIG